MAELLSDDAVTQALADLPGWERDGDSIVRTAELPGFPAAISVVDEVAAAAEAANHHPDIDIRYSTLTFRLSTHSEGGLTAKDPDLAATISAVIDRHS
ncbi:4a-hydroxytetrahydrobiopterin dehydratase [Actinomycetospora termitidis]|uniref:Putative pterin-4-alpha-carbinolamine dehydratase n=1 Tax=Actinomycetospora termitidis TaxID=3053470 RepID=A0ABT7M9M1_9PSEU|nr:4a-hydroxytetrahydrobiopterin dehydratase [Actinomycetospora sp. Odt1-22]MDL5157373.1 4a-hydroxytetrahydrobiopterin dehydratase [Actinomycetospora sp. Odt1-22]